MKTNKIDENGCNRMKLDENNKTWLLSINMDENVWKAMQSNLNGWKGMILDENGWIGIKMDETVWKWMKRHENE